MLFLRWLTRLLHCCQPRKRFGVFNVNLLNHKRFFDMVHFRASVFDESLMNLPVSSAVKRALSGLKTYSSRLGSGASHMYIPQGQCRSEVQHLPQNVYRRLSIFIRLHFSIYYKILDLADLSPISQPNPQPYVLNSGAQP